MHVRFHGSALVLLLLGCPPAEKDPAPDPDETGPATDTGDPRDSADTSAAGETSDTRDTGASGDTGEPAPRERCDGVDSDGDGEVADELGVATWYGTGEPVDLTAALAAGTVDAPAAWAPDEPGTLALCGGTWSLAIQAVHDLAVVGLHDPTLTGSGAPVVHSIDAALSLTDLAVADATAGGIVAEGGTVSVSRAAFDRNVAEQGAAIAAYGAPVTLLDVAVFSSVAREAGGVLVEGADLTIDQGWFHQNQSKDGPGGALVVRGDDGSPEIHLTGVIFTQNRSTAGGISARCDGGAFLVEDLDGPTVSLTAAELTVHDNTADCEGGSGGGLRLDLRGLDADGTGAVSLSDLETRDNRASAGGGVSVALRRDSGATGASVSIVGLDSEGDNAGNGGAALDVTASGEVVLSSVTVRDVRLEANGEPGGLSALAVDTDGDLWLTDMSIADCAVPAEPRYPVEYGGILALTMEDLVLDGVRVEGITGLHACAASLMVYGAVWIGGGTRLRDNDHVGLCINGRDTTGDIVMEGVRAEGNGEAGIKIATRHAGATLVLADDGSSTSGAVANAGAGVLYTYEPDAGAPQVTVSDWDFGAVDGVDNRSGDFWYNEDLSYWDDDASFTCDASGCRR